MGSYPDTDIDLLSLRNKHTLRLRQQPDCFNHGTLNPLIPKSDKHLISPYNITTESNFKVMRIKEMITNQRSP